MTRLELIQLLVSQAKANGFQLKKWYGKVLGLPWQSSRHACEMLASEKRYYALLFSHEFASHFWKPGEVMTFTIEKQSYSRRMKDGTIRVVQRKGYIRRSGRPDAWKFHLRELAVAEDPLRYMRRYLKIEEDLDPESGSPLRDPAKADELMLNSRFNQVQTLARTFKEP